MRIQAISTALFAGLALTACGGGGGGGLGGIGAPGAPSASLGEVYRAQPTGSLLQDPFAVDQAMRGNPDFAASNTQGATGVIALAPLFGGAPSLRDVRMSLNEAGTILTLQIQGRPTVQLNVEGDPSTIAPSFGAFFDGEFVSLSMFDDTGTVTYSDTRNLPFSVNGSGIFGLETPLDRLPTGTSVAYFGTFETLGYNSDFSFPVLASTDGDLFLLVNFDGGTISGTTSGDITYIPTGGPLVQDLGASGTVSGVLAGNGVSGTFTLVGDVTSATHSFEGNFFGWNADDLGGGVIGSVSTPDGTGFTYGTFETVLD